MNPYAAPETVDVGIPRKAEWTSGRVSISKRLQLCYQKLRLCRPRAWTKLTLLVVILWFTYGIIRNWSSPDRARTSLDTRQIQWRFEVEMNDVSPLPIGWPFFSVRPIGWFKWDTNWAPATPSTPGAIADFFPLVAVLNFVLITAVSIAIVYVCQAGRKQYLPEISLLTIMILIGVSLVAHKSRQIEVKAGLDLLVNLAYFIPVLYMFFSMLGQFVFPTQVKAEQNAEPELPTTGF